MKIGSTHEVWIGQRPKIKPYLRWGRMWPCLEPIEDNFVPCYRWHGRASFMPKSCTAVHCTSSANLHLKAAHMSSPYLAK